MINVYSLQLYNLVIEGHVQRGGLGADAQQQVHPGAIVSLSTRGAGRWRGRGDSCDGSAQAGGTNVSTSIYGSYVRAATGLTCTCFHC